MPKLTLFLDEPSSFIEARITAPLIEIPSSMAREPTWGGTSVTEVAQLDDSGLNEFWEFHWGLTGRGVAGGSTDIRGGDRYLWVFPGDGIESFVGTVGNFASQLYFTLI
ncbi:hypothetical protein PanWU01x14_086750 [Parasponia andersonii]|uniref:Uncharacterized protein n=1 Tax=Parasponia andersonii TaxID=3476 RepID=A0A2P5D8G3_PARAD|nr:hypothetical protein PanWU01x14_086750 [Parasponia andersonii]